jgi:hypothetical protein
MTYGDPPHSGKVVEFYPNKQGRPANMKSADMGTGRPPTAPGSVPGTSITNVYGSVGVTTNYTASTSAIILVDASGGPVTITLPTASSNRGRHYTIKKIDSSANLVRVLASDLLDGADYIDMTLQYQYMRVVCSGTEWYVIGGVSVKLEEILQGNLEELVDLNNQVLMELKLHGLHLTSMSDEVMEESDAS